jgi:hypothetical protein
VETKEQLGWEERIGRPVAVACFACAALLVAALFYGTSIAEEPAPGVETDTVYTFALVADHKSEVILLGVMQALGSVLLAAPLWFLFKATKFRKEDAPAAAKWLAILGPLFYGAVTLIQQINFVDVAERVTNELRANPRAPEIAEQLADDERAAGAAAVLQGLSLAATLALAFAFVLVCLNAMRAGLLSRFMGILGIIVGALFVLPLLGNVPFVQVFWVGAIGLLVLGKWPQGGRGPAWDTGEAEPWPTARDRAEQMAAARAAREEEFADDEELEPEPSRTAVGAGRRPGPDPDDGDADGMADRRQSPHPRSKKRKRKRR